MELLAEAGVRPRKRLGQHFLIDGNLMRRLVSCAELDPLDCVLEVGAGTGGLTDLIAGRVRRILCVEVDRFLCGILQDRLGNRFDGDARSGEVALIHGDILENKHRILTEVDQAIRNYDGGSTGCVKLVANLPYQVATPLVMNLLVDYPQVRRLCFTVQSEVGERITSGPNCKAYGPLSIIAQALCETSTVARIPPQAFWPRPSVDSVMIRMDRVGQVESLTEVASDAADLQPALQRFVALVRGTFDHRRKTLRSALGYVTDEAQRSRVEKRFDATRRPESFSVKEWLAIFRAVEGMANGE